MFMIEGDYRRETEKQYKYALKTDPKNVQNFKLWASPRKNGSFRGGSKTF